MSEVKYTPTPWASEAARIKLECHDDLLGVCKEWAAVSERIKDLLTGDSCNDTGLYDFDRMVAAALAKAEGEE